MDVVLAEPPADPASLLVAFHDLDAPAHRNEHISAAALRADAEDVARLGRYLVRHSPDRCSVQVGLALLATGRAERDIPLLQTIALLSDTFSPLACEALRRRRGGGEALEWLASRVDGWGRVYVVQALCERMTASARQWLLRHGCSDAVLSGYFAGKIAIHADLHTAITTEDDADLVDHTTRLLSIMSTCHGQGMTLDDYPAAPAVLTAHAACLSRLEPTVRRVLGTVMIAHALTGTDPDHRVKDSALGDRTVGAYMTLLRQPSWQATLQAAQNNEDAYTTWVLNGPAKQLGLLGAQPNTGESG